MSIATMQKKAINNSILTGHIHLQMISQQNTQNTARLMITNLQAKSVICVSHIKETFTSALVITLLGSLVKVLVPV